MGTPRPQVRLAVVAADDIVRQLAGTTCSSLGMLPNPQHEWQSCTAEQAQVLVFAVCMVFPARRYCFALLLLQAGGDVSNARWRASRGPARPHGPGSSSKQC
jgi:hypothetical protein